MYLNSTFGIVALVVTSLSFACRRDNFVDPCKNAEPFTSSLKIAEIQGDSLLETDTILINSYVSFSAGSTNYASYEWKIGEMNSTFKGKEVRLLFSDREVYPGQLIKVTLVARGVPNKACFTNDDSVDIVDKSFRIIHWKDAPIIGKYAGFFGSDKDKNDKQVVEVRYNSPDSLFEYGRFDLFNINKGCNSTITNPSLKYPYDIFSGLNGARFMVFIAGGETGGNFTNSCLAPGAILRLKGRDTLTVNFTYSKSELEPSKRISDSFTGVRIH